MHRRTLLHTVAAALGFATTQAGAETTERPAPEPNSLLVEAVQMPAWIEQAGERIPIEPGGRVATNQPLETGGDAAVVLRWPDGSHVRLGERTRLEVPRLEVEQRFDGPQVRSRVRLVDGFLRFTTSAVARATSQREIDLTVRTVTIGIRGTDFWTMTDAAHDAACLFEGRIELATPDQGPLVLDQPTAFWARFFDRPAQPVGQATPQELAKFLASTELRPGRGIAVAGGRWRTVAAELASAPAAAALAKRLRVAGYPAQVRARGRVHEVRINRLATRQDAATVLEKIAAIEGVRGRVARAA